MESEAETNAAPADGSSASRPATAVELTSKLILACVLERSGAAERGLDPQHFSSNRLPRLELRAIRRRAGAILREYPDAGHCKIPLRYAVFAISIYALSGVRPAGESGPPA